MRVLGLDPGSRKTGFGVIERNGNRFRCLHYGHASAPARAELAERLHSIASQVRDVMQKYKPDCVVVEEAFYRNNVRSTLVLGHVRGALILTALECGIELAEYTPREIKMSVTGSGAASKEQVNFMVKRILALKGTIQEDAADALAGALCHHHRVQRAAPRQAAKAAARSLGALLAKRVVSRKETASLLAVKTAGSSETTLISGGRIIGRRVGVGRRRAARVKP
jgi:crossover junction endodeoxyribonuclease RuvC